MIWFLNLKPSAVSGCIPVFWDKTLGRLSAATLWNNWKFNVVWLFCFIKTSQSERRSRIPHISCFFAYLKSSYTHNLYWLCFLSSWPGGGTASSHALAEDSVPKCQSTCCQHYENWNLFTYYGELRSRGSVCHLNVHCVLSSGTLWVDKEKQNLNLHKRATRAEESAHTCREDCVSCWVLHIYVVRVAGVIRLWSSSLKNSCFRFGVLGRSSEKLSSDSKSCLKHNHQ